MSAPADLFIAGDWGTSMPADVAALALFLAADDSRMITGQQFVIDAGRT